MYLLNALVTVSKSITKIIGITCLVPIEACRLYKKKNNYEQSKVFTFQIKMSKTPMYLIYIPS